MVRPKPNAPPIDKGKGKATAPAKGKTSSTPLPKIIRAVTAMAATRPRPQGQREYGIKSIPPSTKAWYKIYRPKHMHLDLAIDECCLRANYVFGNLGDINVSLVREFYARYDLNDPEQYVPIRGRLIDFSVTTLYNCLGTPDVPHEPLGNFIGHPTYRELRHNLCGVNFVAAWVRDKMTGRLRKFPKKKMKLEAQVLLKLINTRLLPCNHDTLIGRERSKRIDRLFFDNMITRYLRKEEVEEELEFYIVIPAPLRGTDITSIRPKKENDMNTLTCAERNARDDRFMAHFYGMLNLQLQIRGRPATQEERANLHDEGQRLPEDEDVNTLNEGDELGDDDED
ncbi:hypothetical protein A4A49_51234 [Nicotiana attenuata]|uniref:Putative plant transposon protein domain-containing protein n=1 Tax=Nicotiana attenuata TaxID=49451 RepID=A0A314L464_NICAT|nr:hypothetical protein A4A49_51234 [Nicotiana attenuata]